MAEDDLGERTEQATPRKREEARERGQVAKSTDLNVALLLLCAFVTLLVYGDAFAEGISRLMRGAFAQTASFEATPGNVAALLSGNALSAALLLAPFAAVLAAMALVANLVQVGPLWASTVLTPQMDRLNPVRGFKRIASLRGVMRTAMGVGKLTIIALVLYLVLGKYIAMDGERSIFALFSDDMVGAFRQAKTASCELGITCAAAMLCLALLDFFYQRYQQEIDLRMTKYEVREEMKRFEGDPKVKERRRRIQRQIAFQRYMKEVPKADVVVTNPTEYAVAIAYDPANDAAPRVVAKGEGLLAVRIREVAIAAGVPVVQRPPLARALYAAVEAGQEIPRQMYEAVADVLAYVWRISGRHRNRVA